MNKIKLTKTQLANLESLSTETVVREPKYVRDTMCENLDDAIRICRSLIFEITDLENALNSVLESVEDRRVDEVITKLREAVGFAKTLKEDIDLAENYISGGVSKLLAVCEEGDSFNVIVENNDIKNYIDKNFEISPVLSLGYSEGRFALIFGEDDDGIDIEPFIFALGNAEDYEKAQCFVETFLDLEEIDDNTQL